MIPPVSYVPNIWDLLSKVHPIEPKAVQRPKRNGSSPVSTKQQPNIPDPVLGKIIDIRI
ncbi:hypothetical protein [Ammoniphilus sp. 3BR4]|uniref:hypothetical protein n=1 Tax=Ammoniphilus sp. 3BR4 TaxID=3158265 RepID=UPI00346782C9